MELKNTIVGFRGYKVNVLKHEGNTYFTGWAGLHLFFRERHPENGSKAAVVLVHGYAQHADWLLPVENLILSAGFSVFSFDMRGHGRSEGVRCDAVRFSDFAKDIGTAVEYLREKNNKVFVLSHSLGASAAVFYAGSSDATVDGLITSAVYVVDAEGYEKWKHVAGRIIGPFVPLLPIQELDPERFSQDPAVADQYREDPLVYHGGVRIRMGMHFMDMEKYLHNAPSRIEVPLLMVHGKDDRLASIEGSRMIYKGAASGDKQLLEIDNCGHEVLKDYPWRGVCDTIIQWLDDHR